MNHKLTCIKSPEIKMAYMRVEWPRKGKPIFARARTWVAIGEFCTDCGAFQENLAPKKVAR